MAIENACIYQIRNLKTNNIYLGQTIHPNSRKYSHFYALKLGTHGNRHLQNSYNKYGAEHFEFTIVLYCEAFELDRYEQELVNRLKPYYNICKQVVTSAKGVKRTEKFKQHKSKVSKFYANRLRRKEGRDWGTGKDHPWYWMDNEEKAQARRTETQRIFHKKNNTS